VRRQELEREKLRKSAVATDGFVRGISLSYGIVVGAEGLSVSNSLFSHGTVIPWLESRHIKILVGAD
jgi:hypothetical protein